MAELKPCPFCGGEVSLVPCDDEGNLHDEAYREHPYSGLGFMLHHAHEDNPECPIASYECDGGIMLTLTYMKTMATELLIGGLGGRTFRT